MKWRRDRNGAASTPDGYAQSDRIAQQSAVREAGSPAYHVV
jgi:hypothetical protein